MARDLYETLGVERAASPREIRRAYRRLARLHHPDVNPDDPASEERFKEISYAHEVLSDRDKRARYDRFGEAGLGQGSGTGPGAPRWRGVGDLFGESAGGLDDLLAGLFGGRRRRGADTERALAVEFLDAVRGCEVRTRGADGTPLRVRIPPGTDIGARIRVAGKGEPGPAGGPPGDLYLRLSVRPHRFFGRAGSDLLLELPVTPAELVSGATVRVPTLAQPVSMQIPAGSRNGRTLRLRGKGVPGRDGRAAGDLRVVLALRLPETDDARLAELAHEMEALYPEGDLRAELFDDDPGER